MVYTQISSNDIVISKEKASFSVWSDGQTILTPKNHSAGLERWWGAIGNQNNDFNEAGPARS